MILEFLGHARRPFGAMCVPPSSLSSLSWKSPLPPVPKQNTVGTTPQTTAPQVWLFERILNWHVRGHYTDDPENFSKMAKTFWCGSCLFKHRASTLISALVYYVRPERKVSPVGGVKFQQKTFCVQICLKKTETKRNKDHPGNLTPPPQKKTWKFAAAVAMWEPSNKDDGVE